MFTKDGLANAEGKLIELYDSNRAAYDGEGNVHWTMRYVYYVGETFRRAFEGTWVVIPPLGDRSRRAGLLPGVDLQFRENFVNPTQLIHLALPRRSGIEITRVYGTRSGTTTNGWMLGSHPAPISVRCEKATKQPLRLPCALIFRHVCPILRRYGRLPHRFPLSTPSGGEVLRGQILG